MDDPIGPGSGGARGVRPHAYRGLRRGPQAPEALHRGQPRAPLPGRGRPALVVATVEGSARLPHDLRSARLAAPLSVLVILPILCVSCAALMQRTVLPMSPKRGHISDSS